MEVRGGRTSRDMSPERIKICTQPRVKIRPTFKRVQVVYYLSRNGQLEHPHYMEVTHLANQQLRLKDVIDRLTVLRGKGMPSLYSWSCKRSYKNGYVWNDLAENDVIYPSEGAEYILKGSEIISTDGCTEKYEQQQFQQHPLGNTRRVVVVEKSTSFHPKCKQQDPPHKLPPHQDPQQVTKNYIQYEEDEADQNGADGDQEPQEVEEYEEKISYTSSTTPLQCSRGVSTDEIHHTIQNAISELNLDTESPPSTTSSSLSDKANETNNTSKRYEDGDPIGNEPLLSRNSMLFQLIACGGSLSFRGKNVPVLKQEQPSRRSNCSELHKGVLCKNVEMNNKEVDEEDEIKYMSENPRFGNLQAEEKEYFSGSIVESMVTEERVGQVGPSCLKKSSSYNEERCSKLALEAVVTEEEEEAKREKASKGKCIPRKKSSSKQSKK
ncbi:hypothetical protein ACH5RR_012432 [Cinchona calisaya]|uniref:SOSEKI DIX-like domain-containing protein n=1 Tax=Cinchona calisaya TaxID=153742 RepID=A0ABD3A7M4_9GENT